MTHYIGLLDGEAGAYGVSFPDLPGCTAMGATMDVAWKNAVSSVAEWVQDIGGFEAAPASTPLEVLRLDSDVREALLEGASFITVPLLLESGKSVRANISMDQGVLDAIDAAAQQRGLTRSSFLSSAALEKIAGVRI
ncbi:MAG: type II toxin-antitoxin system HicB family antitoxin [Beijerinckiaceae bacterium]